MEGDVTTTGKIWHMWHTYPGSRGGANKGGNTYSKLGQLGILTLPRRCMRGDTNGMIAK